jgi:hypothetical protein
MLPNFLVGLLLGAGTAAWVYGKTMRQTGNNAHHALVVAGIVGGLAFLAIVVVLSIVFH